MGATFDDGYAAHIATAALVCQCCAHCCDCPCAGTLAGGLCDELRCRCDDEEEDYDDGEE